MVCLTVVASFNGALLEGHDVLRERAGFIREDVLDLAQLLVQRGGSGFGRRVFISVVHLQIPVNELTLTQADHLHAEREQEPVSYLKNSAIGVLREPAVVPHIERNGHHGVEDDDVAPETEEASVR